MPGGGEYKTLEEVADIGTGSHNTNEGLDDGEYPFYVRSQEPLRLHTYDYDERAIITAGDGVGVGKVFHYVEGKYALHQRAYRIHVKDAGLDTKFLLHYMKSTFLSYIEKSMFKGSVASIRRPMLNAYRLPVPPLEVQREIVHILDSFTLLTAELTARKKQYEYYRTQLLSCNTNIRHIQLKDIAEFTYGYTDKAEEKGDTRFIRITDINDDGNLNEDGAKYINLNDDSKKYLLKKGDLLMARTGATYGKTLYYPSNKSAVYASFLIKISLDNDIVLNRYYWHFAKSRLYWNQAEKLVSKGGQQQFNSNAVGRVVVPVPPITVQSKIIDVLDNFDAICSDLNIGLPAEIEARQKQYEFYRDQLLTFAETGSSILTRQDKTRQDKTRQDKTRQDKTRPD
jgi:type I restriction enzyme S subunit